MNGNQLLYGVCILLTGLLAGLFYGWQCSVINGLGKLNDKEYLTAFQSLNKSILNPLFFLSFMGSLIALPVTGFLSYKTGNSLMTPYLITAAIIYAVGVFGITLVCNVPLNDSVALFDIGSATENSIKEMRFKFETSWNNWHLIRTIAAVVTFMILITPLLKKI